VKAECLPFSQIPHSTRLFTDFLAYSPKVQAFYPHSPRFGDWYKEQAGNLQYDPLRRELVAGALERQNRGWNASARTLENIARLRAGAGAVVTGQQVGLFGGPTFAIYKALSAVKLAEQASTAGVEAVPVFWLATQDHDLAEVNHVLMPGAEGSLHNIAVETAGAQDAPVGTVHFGKEIESAVASAGDLVGNPEITALLRESYRPGENFGSAYARLFARLFADWGVVLLDPSDPELQAMAAPLYQASVERVDELNQAILARGKELETAGYHQQVKVTQASALLFGLQHGTRLPVHTERAGGGNAPQFRIGDELLSRTELLKRIAAAPQDFSANVLLRPVLQDYLLPTIAYTGGAAEIAYFAQAAVVYRSLLGRVTPIVPRFSATLINHKLQVLLERYKLSVPQVFQGSEHLRATLAARSLPPELQQTFDNAEADLARSVQALRSALAKLDKTLADSAAHAEEKMRYQLGQLRAKAARAELRQTEILGRHAEFLSQALYPEKTLQEREIAACFFLARHGPQLLPALYDAFSPDCLEHQILFTGDAGERGSSDF
jgi:bacillithiol biosynthesis cysteine-adding enzyme BshC